jgi:phage terminase large subunit-like protein
MMTALPDTDWREHAARHYEPHPRRWPTPGALALALDPATKTSPALEIIDRELVRLTDHLVPAEGLLVFCAPQEGKSQKVSRRYPEWLLADNPGLRIAIVSYEGEMAVRWGRQIKRDIAHADPRVMNVRIMADSSAAGRWDTPEGGGLYCTGVGGSLSGRPVDVLIIDDPVKDREQAESAVFRDRAWDWWESVAIPRLATPPVVVCMQTRWHMDDLSGRILSRPSPLRWRVLSMPAIAVPGDPLGRQPGEEFPSVRGRPPGYFTQLRATMTPYVFSGLYQQDPVAAAGNFFRRQTFRYWRNPPGMADAAGMLAAGRHAGAVIELDGRRVDLADPGVWRFATCDLAASTSTQADWTVFAVWAIDQGGDLILLDRRRARIDPSDHFAMARPLRDRWRYDVLYVPREWWAKTLILDGRAAGVPVAEVTTDTDKITRAIPAAGRLHAGRVWWPAETSGCQCGQCSGAWLEEWEAELAAFDRGVNDDQVDTFSAAARVVAAHWTPPAPPTRAAPPAGVEAIEQAYAAASGNGTHQPDLMTMPLLGGGDRMLSVLIGIVVVIVAVVEWFGHITVIHALAILTGLVGLSIVLAGLGDRGGRYTRL